MGFFSGLKTAATLDRLSNSLGLDSGPPPPRRDLYWSTRIMTGLSQMSAGLIVEMSTDEIMRQRKRTERLEREMPGYREELRRQRARLGLPT